MKPEKNADEKFEWDITAVMLIVLVVVALVFLIMAIGPINHLR